MDKEKKQRFQNAVDQVKMEWYNFKIENWKGKLLRILHPFDTYEKHLKRYYNLKSVQKVIKQVYGKEDES